MSLYLLEKSQQLWCQRWKFPLNTALLFFVCTISFFTVDAPSSRQARLLVPVVHDGRWWLFLSCTILHLNIEHLAVNMIMLVACGSIFEYLHGGFATQLVFWTGSLVGISMENELYSGEKKMLLCGASAGTYALFTCHFAHLLMNWSEMPLKCLWIVTLLIILISLIIEESMPKESNIKIAHMAHLFGAIQGFFTGVLTVKNLKISSIEVVMILGAFVGSTILVLYPFF